MFRTRESGFWDRIRDGVADIAPAARLVPLTAPPVAGAALLGLDRLAGGARRAPGRGGGPCRHRRLGRRGSADGVGAFAREEPRELGPVGQAGLIAGGRDRQGAAGIAHPERSLEIDAVEPAGDEPRTERIAGADRIDHMSQPAGL